jgi:cobalt-precorrin 5A hydrolase
MFERGVAIVTLTKRGVATSMRIARALDKAQIRYGIYAPDSLRSDGITPFGGGLGGLFSEVFNEFDAIIAVMAIGIVVRSIAPYISNKKTDPAVVVVDDLGKYAISLLSGHIRGANRLTKLVAGEIGAIAVVTTATELLGRKSVEEIAEERNLKIVNSECLTEVNSAIVNDRKILFVTIGPAASPEEGAVPQKVVSNVDELKEMMDGYDAGIVIAPSIVPLGRLRKPVALLIPRPNDRPPNYYRPCESNQRLTG